MNGVFTDGFHYFFLRLVNGTLYYSVPIEDRDRIFALMEVALAGGDVFEPMPAPAPVPAPIRTPPPGIPRTHSFTIPLVFFL